MSRVHAITYRFYWLLYQASNINSCTFTMHKKTKKKHHDTWHTSTQRDNSYDFLWQETKKKYNFEREKTICTHLCVSLETQLRLRADEKASLQFKESLLLWKAVYSTMRPLKTIHLMSQAKIKKNWKQCFGLIKIIHQKWFSIFWVCLKS